ncbi:hypothetical protein ACHHV8_00260 [Paenibacillus sp. TAB 01]|uniref:hypothetical protein n=1 Tax=Paenibacillus sp. TAB 01 TaxID=3368988 RepID=UPI003752AB83
MQLNLNTEQLKKRLKENIERNIVTGHQLQDTYFSNVEKLIEIHNISDVHYFSHRKFLGKFIIAFKKIVRKLMRPILNKQIIFNQLMIENIRFLQQQVKQNQTEQLRKVEDLLTNSIDEIINDFESYQVTRNTDLTEVVLSNNDLAKDFQKFKEEITTDTKLVTQIDLLKCDVEKLTAYIEEIKQESIKEASKNILIEISDFYYKKNEFDLSYHLLLSALKYDPQNIELERKLLSVFDTLNKSRDLQ